MKLGTLLCLTVALISNSLAQGPLTPPGAPAPTMKSLDQIEARTPISTAPFTINSGGSYYLTQNLTVASGNAITINASNVTLDLNGFTISSTANPAAGGGIYAPGVQTGIVIRNGAIRGTVTWNGTLFSGEGFTFGISLTSCSGVHADKVHISGIKLTGMLLPEFSSYAKDCIIVTCGATGLSAETAEGCSVTKVGALPISSKTAIKCVGETVSNNFNGITTTIATDCRGASINASGISATTVNNSYGISGSGIGIQATTANNSVGDSTVGTGISATIVNNSTGTSISSHGVVASMAVMNSFGFGGGTGDGIRCTGGVVTNSFGKIALSGTGVGLRALTANGSRGTNSSDVISQVITNKYNMP